VEAAVKSPASVAFLASAIAVPKSYVTISLRDDLGNGLECPSEQRVRIVLDHPGCRPMDRDRTRGCAAAAQVPVIRHAACA